MDLAQTISNMPKWAFFCLIVVVSVLAAEGGTRVAQHRGGKGLKDSDASISTAVGAMLALLAFMLGFTFSLTAARFADRKQLVIEQANSIGTCFLRTSLIPVKQKLEIRKLLREYVAVLVQMSRQLDIEKYTTRLEEIHPLLWQQTSSLAQETMDPQLRVLFITSVNDVIDLYSERKTVALVFRIPDVLWLALILLNILSMFTLGYLTSSSNKPRIFDTPLMAAAIALVMALIADMDTTSGGRGFKVSQQPLIELKEMIKNDAP